MNAGRGPRGRARSSRRAPGEVSALDGIDLTVADGEFVSLIGPSGCGKSTLLRLIADLDEPTSGELTVFGRIPQQARRGQDYGIAFQQAGLLAVAHASRANVELPLELHGVGPGRSAPRGRPSCWSWSAWRTSPGTSRTQLSGGMQQRVAIARALARAAAACC